MEHNDRLLSLMKQAVDLVRDAQEKRKELREGKITGAEASQFLKEWENEFNAVQNRIGEEMRRENSR